MRSIIDGDECHKIEHRWCSNIESEIMAMMSLVWTSIIGLVSIVFLALVPLGTAVITETDLMAWLNTLNVQGSVGRNQRRMSRKS